MLRKLTITQKGLALIAVPLLCQLLVAAALFRGQAYRTEVEEWAIHTKRVIVQAETYYRTLVESDSQVNTFVVGGQARAGQAFEKLIARLPAEDQALRELVADNPPQLARLDAVAPAIQRLASQMVELEQRVLRKDTAAATEEMQLISDENALVGIREAIDSFIDHEETLDKKRLESLANIQHTMRVIVLAGMAVVVMVSALCAWLFGRTIVRRLVILNENVRRFSAGETLAERVGGGDEVAMLDDSFHQMTTELAAASAKEKEFQENLERRAGELTVMNRELMQKSDENEMFVYSVSHDLRSPLVNLQGFSKELGIAMREMRELMSSAEVSAGLRAQGADILDHGMQEPVTFIQTAVTRLSAIIDALLRLSRAGRVEYQRKEVEVNSIVRRIIDASRATISEKNAQVSIVGELPQVWGDPTAVEQMFANIIGNALNYLDKKRPGVIEISGKADEANPDLAVCCVRDNGLGIPEAYLGKVFGIFQRVHGNVAVGEGIGLALVKRMVERHGGRIWVESKEGVGSTFFVALPKVHAAEEVEAGLSQAASAEIRQD